MKTLQIQIVTWNSISTLPGLLDSIRNQTVQPDRVLIIDNSSEDSTQQFLRNTKGIEYLLLPKNTGFCHAHNIGFLQGGDYTFILCLNPDIVLKNDAVEKLLRTAKLLSNLGSISPILQRNALTKTGDDRIIDCAGIGVNAFFRFYHLYEGQKNISQHQPFKVFGNSGACVMYSRSALNDIVYTTSQNDREYFDEQIFAYKEDIDLSWRLAKKGYSHIVIPEFLAQHTRSIHQTIPIRNRPKKIKYFSYRNHILILLKNLTFKDILFKGIPIALYEFSKFMYYSLTSPDIVYTSFIFFLTAKTQILAKRKAIQR